MVGVSDYTIFVLRWQTRYETALSIHIHGEKSRILFSYSFFCLKTFSFPFFSFFSLIPISILFSVSMFSLFFFPFLFFLATCIISHQTTFCSLSYNFFTDKGIPAHFLTHARILNRHHSLVHHPLSPFLFLFLSLAMWIMMRTLSESRESYQKRIVQRKHRFFQPYHTLLFHLFLSATRFIKSPWDHPL